MIWDSKKLNTQRDLLEFS